ncbi:MAG: glycerol kinase GlpK [Phycisphaerales bacterium JB037]
MPDLVCAIDQGTTSTRCILFDARARPISSAQREHAQICPRPGWVEHDAAELWNNTQIVIKKALASAKPASVAAVGITNQRETVVLWDRATGQPVSNAIVWQDTRTRDLCERLARPFGRGRFRERTGLPLSTYFSGPKIRWLLDEHPEWRPLAERGDLLAGTIDSWLIWNLTGGADPVTRSHAAHVTDATNASRTLLMDLRTLDWDDEVLNAMGVPRAMLPRIVPSADPEPWGLTDPAGPLGARVPVCGAVGDQQAALLGQAALEPGATKNTYGTGCFMLLHTGGQPVASAHGLLTTVALKLADKPATYALEGSVAIAGALVQWLRDNLGLLGSSGEIEQLARSVPDSGGVAIVPAFNGLFAPHWRDDARGVITGLTRHTTRAHLARAALEATCLQTREVLDAMRADAGLDLPELRVDGGMVRNDLLMQMQADLLDLPVVRPAVWETTALGAAFAAGLAAGFFDSTDAVRDAWRADRRWEPAMPAADRDRLLARWKRAVERSFGLAE